MKLFYPDNFSNVLKTNFFKNMLWLCHFIYLFIFLSVFLGLHMKLMKFPRLGVKSELHPLAYTTATVMSDLSHICNLQCSSPQCWILNPLSETRDQTHILMGTSRVHNPLSHNGNSQQSIFKNSMTGL